MAESQLHGQTPVLQETEEEPDFNSFGPQRQEAPTLPLTAQHGSTTGQETGNEEEPNDIHQKQKHNSNHENIALVSEYGERYTSIQDVDLQSPQEEVESIENADQGAQAIDDDTEESAHSDCNISEEEFRLTLRQQEESHDSIDDSNQESLTRPFASSSEFLSSKEKNGQRQHKHLSEHQDSSPPGHNKIHAQRKDGDANAVTLRKQVKVPDEECAMHKRQEPKIKNKTKVSKKGPDWNQKSSSDSKAKHDECVISKLEKPDRNEIFKQFFFAGHHPNDQDDDELQGIKVKKVFIVAQLMFDNKNKIRTYKSRRNTHAEETAIRDLTDICRDIHDSKSGDTRTDCVLILYISMSPCTDCSIRLQQFLSDMEKGNIIIALQIVSVSLYRINLPYCKINCEGVHGKASQSDHTRHMESLIQLGKSCYKFRVFDKSDWNKLRDILEAEVPDTLMESCYRGSRADHDQRLASFLETEIIGTDDKRHKQVDEGNSQPPAPWSMNPAATSLDPAKSTFSRTPLRLGLEDLQQNQAFLDNEHPTPTTIPP